MHSTRSIFSTVHEAVVSDAGVGVLVMPSPDEADSMDMLGLDADGLTPRENVLLVMLARLDGAGFEPLEHETKPDAWATLGALPDGRAVVMLRPSRPIVAQPGAVADALDGIMSDLVEVSA